MYSYLYVYVLVLLCLCILVVIYPSGYSVSLCYSVYCFVCECVLHYCHWLSTQLQLTTNISYTISYFSYPLIANGSCGIIPEHLLAWPI